MPPVGDFADFQGASHRPSHSLQSWAAQVSALQSQLFSEQALHRRCGKGLVNFLELLLATVLGNLTRRDRPTGGYSSTSEVPPASARASPADAAPSVSVLLTTR